MDIISWSVFLLSICIIILEIDVYRMKKLINEIIDYLEMQDEINKKSLDMFSRIISKKEDEK